ncbi:unnamed protein product [Cylicostephanus goldi]|uniref:NADH dehydrogenase [ubiquinone] 1 beta subcomplex subunit 9 n=1 Tax=Cylicostephanus goldi TaxID=71465 RepID=A0A3P6SUW2_CYLGO|nr:unnamed protein product [Cylicostephanus goldi]
MANNFSSLEMRYQKVILRARFDANKDEKDMRKSQFLLADGCRQLWEKKHWKPFNYPLDPGGSSYDRERESPDVVSFSIKLFLGSPFLFFIILICLSPRPFSAGSCGVKCMLDSDQWTLAEREQFPYYFNRREQRKKVGLIDIILW